MPRCLTNLKVDEKLKLSGARPCNLQVSSPLLYHWATSDIIYLDKAEEDYYPGRQQRQGQPPQRGSKLWRVNTRSFLKSVIFYIFFFQSLWALFTSIMDLPGYY